MTCTMSGSMAGTRKKTILVAAAARALAIAVAFPFALTWGGGGCNHIGDQLCPADSFDPNMRSEDCPFGPPGGPKVRETGCAENVIDKTNPACGTLSWIDDIWPLLTTGQ